MADPRKIPPTTWLKLGVGVVAIALVLTWGSSGPSVLAYDIGEEPGGLLVRNDPGYQADGAEFIGKLTVVDGCVFLSSGSPQQKRTPVVWPHGTKWQTEPPGLLLPRGRFVAVGEELTMGGGTGRLRDDDLPQNVVDVLDFCGEPGNRSVHSLG